jgi:hypothetical protein
MYFIVFHYIGNRHLDTEVYCDAGKYLIGRDDSHYMP